MFDLGPIASSLSFFGYVITISSKKKNSRIAFSWRCTVLFLRNQSLPMLTVASYTITVEILWTNTMPSHTSVLFLWLQVDLFTHLVVVGRLVPEGPRWETRLQHPGPQRQWAWSWSNTVVSQANGNRTGCIFVQKYLASANEILMRLRFLRMSSSSHQVSRLWSFITDEIGFRDRLHMIFEFFQRLYITPGKLLERAAWDCGTTLPFVIMRIGFELNLLSTGVVSFSFPAWSGGDIFISVIKAFNWSNFFVMFRLITATRISSWCSCQ